MKAQNEGRIKLAKKQAFKITAIYLVVGSLWIIFSDMLTERLISERYDVMLVSMAKGILYVVSTAMLLYFLIYSALKKLTDSEFKLSKSEAMLRTVFNQAPIGIVIVLNEADKYLGNDDFPSINPMFEKITGRTKEELKGCMWQTITHPDDLKKEIMLTEQLMKNEITSFSMQKRYLKPDGSVSWASKTAVPLIFEDDANKYSLFLIQDINESKAVAEALAESERSKSFLLANLMGMAYRCKYDDVLSMQFVSDGCLELTGYPVEYFLQHGGASYVALISDEYKVQIENEFEKMLAQRLPHKYEYEIITSSGQRKWVLDIGRGVYDKNGNVEAIEGIIIDITERKQHEMQLKYLSERDGLTGLYNRRSFEEILTKEVSKGDEDQRAVIFLDLTKLNYFNMAYGYSYSENLIKEITMQLSLLCDNKCRIFQISFERIAFYIDKYEERKELTVICERILGLLETMQVRESLGCNIGILEIGKCQYTAADVLKNVSIAAAKSNDNPEVPYYFFEDKLKEELARKAILKDELSAAAFDETDDSIFLLYQPILDAKTDKIYGFEALARFESKKIGIISPLEFIGLAEETQAIIPIGRRILRKACGFIQELETLGHNKIVIAVNVSAVQMLRNDFVADVENIIKETAVNPKMLTLEVTESMFLTSYESVNKAIEQLRELGIRFAIDDFGVGYSSLARERELHVDIIKMDKYFADDLLAHKENEIIAGDIISMMHKLGHSVVAEGVECEEQKEYLTRHDCDYLQGYLFSKPIQPEKALELLKESD